MSKDSSSGGVGCLTILVGVLQALFIYGKATGEIAWSWWWIASPAIAYTGLVLLILLFVGIISAIAIYFES